MIRTDVVVIAYCSEQYTDRLHVDLPAMSCYEYKLHLWDNSQFQRNISMIKNDLAAAGSAEYILFCSGDVLISPDWDKRMIGFLEKTPDVGAVVPLPLGDHRFRHMWEEHIPLEEFREDPFPDGAHMAAISDRLKDAAAAYFHPCPLFAVMMKRETWERAKGFDERFRLNHGDFDFGNRLRGDFRLNIASLGSCGFFHGAGLNCYGGQKLGSKNPKRMNTHAEVQWGRKLFGFIYRGAGVMWHRLSDQDRAFFREQPTYTHLPYDLKN